MCESGSDGKCLSKGKCSFKTKHGYCVFVLEEEIKMDEQECKV